MIYQLVNYLKIQFPAFEFNAEGYHKGAPDEVIVVSVTTGEAEPWYDRQDYNVQILSRATSSYQARENINTIYSFLPKRFGLILPSFTEDTVIYPEVKTAQIITKQIPSNLGAQYNGLNLYSCNFKITTTIF